MGMLLFFAFDVGRMLPNTDLSRDFMELVVDRWVGGSWRADEKEPGIEIGLNLFDLFILSWAKHKKPGEIERTL